MKVKKNTTFKSYLFGDFDKDGTKNIDDPKPFDPKVKKWPDMKKNPSYYHKARWGNNEVLLSNELRAWQKYNNQSSPFLKSFLKANPRAEGRIKTVPSTMQKVRQRYIQNIGDVAGARILTQNRSQASSVFGGVKKRYRYDKKETDDYYAKPKGGVYYAYHTTLISDKGNKLELQVKSKKMDDLAYSMHKSYKHGGSINKFVRIAKDLYKKGY